MCFALLSGVECVVLGIARMSNWPEAGRRGIYGNTSDSSTLLTLDPTQQLHQQPWQESEERGLSVGTAVQKQSNAPRSLREHSGPVQPRGTPRCLLGVRLLERVFGFHLPMTIAGQG